MYKIAFFPYTYQKAVCSDIIEGSYFGRSSESCSFHSFSHCRRWELTTVSWYDKKKSQNYFYLCTHMYMCTLFFPWRVGIALHTIHATHPRHVTEKKQCVNQSTAGEGEGHCPQSIWEGGRGLVIWYHHHHHHHHIAQHRDITSLHI